MQSSYPAVFDREMGCTEKEWRGWLPRALGDHWPHPGGDVAQVLTRPVPDGVPVASAEATDSFALTVAVGTGRLTLSWLPLAPRRLGLAVLPRLWVRFEFEGLAEPQRHSFMKRFDLYTQRGGG